MNGQNKGAGAPDEVTDGIEEFPLPEGVALDAMLEDGADAKPSRPAPKPEVADLAFTGKRVRSRTVDLAFPFEIDGRIVDSVTIRRLNGFEIAELAGVVIKADGGFDRYEVFAAMTGLPAPVLRGLDQDDGVDVLAVCQDFLPRVLATGG
ncbi:phage tail assembly protein [Methylopila sp. M107]|uniref:phage tail assembly protein n=1 Tax=Methylopila sp. M107 TaxID=1101190 RepID=UPI000360C1FB|nr:phage tail assembly protein [Methylopila sp. M107]